MNDNSSPPVDESLTMAVAINMRAYGAAVISIMRHSGAETRPRQRRLGRRIYRAAARPMRGMLDCLISGEVL